MARSTSVPAPTPDAFPHGRVPRAIRERQVVEEAEALFAERGYQGASMDELARRVGVSKPVVYDLVGSKEALFSRCVQSAAATLAQRVAEAVSDSKTLPERVRAGALAFFRFVAEQRLAWAILFADESAGRFASEASGIRRRQAELVAGLIADTAAHEGARTDPLQIDALAHAINGFNEALARWWADHPEVEAEAVAGWSSELLLGGLERAAARRRIG